MKTKRCKKCGKIKPLTEFHKGKRYKDGCRTICKPCRQALHLTGTCPDCGKRIDKSSERCRSCATKAKWAKGSFTEETRRKQSIIKREHWASGVMDSPETQVKRTAAMKEKWAGGSFDGLAEAVSAAWGKGAYDNKETEELRRKRSEIMKARWASGTFANASERMKKQWASGIMDGVFNSPSKPEIALAGALDEAGIGYESQYRLPGDGRRFDFFIPPKMLIEVDGVYWHDDTKHPGVAAKDAAKTALAKQHGYDLIRVTDVELATKGAVKVVAAIRLQGG